MKQHFAVLVVLVCSLSAPANAAECNSSEAYAAESVTDYLDSWQNVYLFFKQFRHCYDGGIAEGAQDKIQQLLADQWPTLPTMIALASEDAEFKAFIWKRISDETFPQESFARFVHHANAECPQIAEEFCRAVAAESKRAMQPNQSLQPTVPASGGHGG